MFCRKCGRPIEGEGTICSACAAEASQVGQNAQPVAELPEQPVDEDLIQPTELASEEPVETFSEEPVIEAVNVFDLNTQAEEDVNVQKKKNKKKKKHGKIWAIGGAVAAVAAVVLVVLNFNAVKGFFLKNFGQPEDYMVHVENQSIGALSDTIAGAYGSLLNTAAGEGSGAARMELELEIGDEVMAMIETVLAQSGAEADLSWLNSVMIALDSNVQDNMAGVDLGIGLSDKQILTLSMIMDMESQKAWFGIPELNKQFIAMDLSDYMDDLQSNLQSATASIEQMQAAIEEMQDVLPSEETVAKLLDKYLDIVLDSIDDVEKDTETKRIDGVSQKLTVLTITVDEEDLYDIVIAVLEEARKDKDIEAIVNDISDYYNDKPNVSYEDIDLYDEFVSAIDELLEELEYVDVDSDSDNYIEIVDYIGKSDKVVGREFTLCSDGQKMELLNYLTVQDGKDFAFEMEIPSVEFELEGSGSEKSNKLNAEFEISYAGMDIAEIDVIDFDSKKLDDGYLNGTLQISPSADLIDMVLGSRDLSASMMSIVEEIALELKFEGSETQSKIGINLISDNELLVGLALGLMEKQAEKVSPPEDAVDISAMDEEAQAALMEWLENVDFDTLIGSLKDAGVPDEYTDVLEELLNSDGFFGPSYDIPYPDYDDDFDF